MAFLCYFISFDTFSGFPPLPLMLLIFGFTFLVLVLALALFFFFFFPSIAFSSLFRSISFLARNVEGTLETVHDCDCDDPFGIESVSSDDRLICGALCLVKSLMLSRITAPPDNGHIKISLSWTRNEWNHVGRCPALLRFNLPVLAVPTLLGTSRYSFPHLKPSISSSLFPFLIITPTIYRHP